ncbi:hypothetical protein F5882DRAFT_457177 [Hyaloscypha sp. PMI_1271]|nr:hypothetical protein F5882DRAFT_457177 [Hyaloscypha sp. PMI_1271]
MASLGKITNSLVSGTNETTLQLAGFNLDFSVLKFEAPKEFTGLGAALSHRRRVDAEDGPLHRTARKLGALFEQILPSTPNLVKAYGSRASAIFETPGVSPRGSRRDGPFENFVGADGSSLWAAATSGSASIAVHLLACMLARSWTAKQATSIWVELVEERKTQVEATVKDGNVLSMSLVMTAQQDIAREQLRLWDDSARSWLQSADAVKFSEQKRLELILKNVNIPISTGTTTYSKVLGAWTSAMTGLENLLSGVPQQICDASILLALSSWHIFPDLLVLGKKTTNVKFKDPLVPGAGVLTVGLQNSDSGKGAGIGWSLALSHLCHYGNPIEVDSEDIKSRVTMEQLHLVAFGSLLASWRVSLEEVMTIARWLTDLWSHLEKASPVREDGQSSETALADHLSWLHVLVQAAKHIVRSKNDELETAMMLLGFGHRRGGSFLGQHHETLVPFFGLCSRAILPSLAINTNIDRGIHYLRVAATLLGLQHDEGIISVASNTNYINHYEYASAVPHKIGPNKHSIDGVLTQERVHCRWFNLEESSQTTLFCDCVNDCSEGCKCRNNGAFCTWRCRKHDITDFQDQNCTNFGVPFHERKSEIVAKGEHCNVAGYGLHLPHKDEESRTVMLWEDPPLLYSNLGSRCHLESKSSSGPRKCSCFDACSLRNNPDQDPISGRIIPHSVIFEKIAGNINAFALWVKRATPPREHRGFGRRLKGPEAFIDYRIASQHIPLLDSRALLEYINAVSTIGCGSLPGEISNPHRYATWEPSAMTLLVQPTFIGQSQYPSLRALSIASRLYERLPGATIPLRIVSMPLCESRWFPPLPRKYKELHINTEATPTLEGREYDWLLSVGLSRSQAFSCVSMFESGNLNLDPSSLNSVMAISAGNSIYVSSMVLSDPYDVVPEYDIRRIVGNVGYAGITLMIAPQDPRIRDLSHDYTQVRHTKYDFEREDNFGGTTLHLSFTNWKMPIDTGARGTVDQDVYYVESVISVHDCGEWVADIDILNFDTKARRLVLCECEDQRAQSTPATSMITRLTSIDNWEELLDVPQGIGIFRARGNWPARLAAASILAKQAQDAKSMGGQIIVAGSSPPCLRCARRITRASSSTTSRYGKLKFFID